jgi:hypothetical protein
MAGARALWLATLAVSAALPVSDRDMQAATEALWREVGAVRHIQPRGTLPRRLVTRDEARAARDEAVAAVAGGPEQAARARLWARLGLLPPGADYPRLLARQLDAPGASYDPGSHRLAVPDWIPLGDQRPALAHALAHALADQRFDLRALLQIGLDGRHGLPGDAERARLALVEGDATVAALELADPRGTFENGAELAVLASRRRAPAARQGAGARPPTWIQETGAFVMADGLLFVARVRARQPWSAVDALWASPPDSSEQILHPEKYDAHERPILVDIPTPKAIGEQWREVATDVLGELGARVWLSAAVNDELAARAAAGWGGDRAILYERAPTPTAPTPDAGPPSSSSSPFVLWSTTWDDVTDAEDFARAAAPTLAAFAKHKATDPPEDPHRFVVHRGDEVFALAWRDTTVVLLVGAPESALATLDDLLPPERTTAKPPRPPSRKSRK